jgi:hypothetical protein
MAMINECSGIRWGGGRRQSKVSVSEDLLITLRDCQELSFDPGENISSILLLIGAMFACLAGLKVYGGAINPLCNCSLCLA